MSLRITVIIVEDERELNTPLTTDRFGVKNLKTSAIIRQNAEGRKLL